MFCGQKGVLTLLPWTLKWIFLVVGLIMGTNFPEEDLFHWPCAWYLKTSPSIISAKVPLPAILNKQVIRFEVCTLGYVCLYIYMT